MNEHEVSNAGSSETSLQAIHRQWALWATRRLRFIHPELTITLYGRGWDFTLHVANCDDATFPDLAKYFDNNIRPITCSIKLSQQVPPVGTPIDDATGYEGELWLNGEPLSAPAFNILLWLADPTLPKGGIDFDHDRKSWVFRSFTSLSDDAKARIQMAASKIGIVGPVTVEVIPYPAVSPTKTSAPNRRGDMSLITSRQLQHAPDSLRHLVEEDEDEWRIFLSQRARQEIVAPDTAQSFACLYDIEHCGDSRLSELLTIYDRVDIMPPINSGLDWCSRHLAPLSDLQELVQLKRLRIILPHSIEKYNSSLLEAVAEVDRSSIVLSRSLAAKTITRGQMKDPLLYAPLTSNQRADILAAIAQGVADQTYRQLIKSYGQLFSGQHSLFMMRGALASVGYGVGAYLGDVFLKLANKDARIELMTCGAGVEWALGLGASYVPRHYAGGYDETWNSQIVASYLGRTKIRRSDPVANRMHIVSDGLLAVADVPPLEVAKNFHSLPAFRFRKLARQLMVSAPDEQELQSAIDQINADVRVFERRTERLARWKLGSLFAGATTAAIEDSVGIGVAASAIASWLCEVLETHIPGKIRNELAVAKDMLVGLATGCTLDAVVVSRCRKTIVNK